VAGAPERLERLERLAMPIRRRGPCIVAGCGAVGSKVAQLLRDAGETCTVIDIRPCPDVDILGNVLESSTLQRAGVREASAMILALSDDSETIFAAAAVRDHAPDVPLIVRVNRARNTERIYRTGVDFAISEGEVAGQILAFHLLGEQFVSVENGIRISRLSAGALAGLHLWQDAVRAHSGASIIAVVRDDEVLMDFDGDFQIHASDALLVCGTVRDLERFQHAFQPPF
jgi:Trk K+ transport system NAD-binding subunit